MADTLVNQLNHLRLAESATAVSSEANPPKDSRICRFFSGPKTCRAGASCRFSHEVAQVPVTIKKKRSRHKGESAPKKPQPTRRKADHIDKFFAGYPTFSYRPTAPVWQEFRRMCDYFGWNTKDKDGRPLEHDEAEQGFKRALVEQFNGIYGKSVYSMVAWRKLCHILNVNPMPKTLEDCREKVRESHVNLVDLVDSPRTGDPVVVFPTLRALQVYTKATGKYFPKEEAYGGLLQFLLRDIVGGHRGGARNRIHIGTTQWVKESSD